MSNESKNNKIRHSKLSEKEINTTTKKEYINSANNSPTQNKTQKNISSPKNTVKTKSKKIISAIIIYSITFLVAILGSIIGGKKRDGLTNPPAYPPEWLFPVMWAILYVAIATAAYIAFIKAKDKETQRNDMICYGVHLFLNMFWTLFYFRLDLLIFSTIWLIFMIITAIVVTYRFYRNNLASGIIFTCYTIWLLYALYLSLGITMLNIGF